jgi:hypothetical protein
MQHGGLFARPARSGKVRRPPTQTNCAASARVLSSRQFFFNPPDVVHECLCGRRVGSTAFGDKTIVQAQPRQFERQQHTIAIINLTRELERQRRSNTLTSENDVLVFLEQQHEGLRVWQEPLVPLRAPLLFNLRTDPFEKAILESGEYEKWYVERMFVMAPAQAIVARELQTFKDFPPRQKPGSFSIGDAMEKLVNTEHSSN